MTLEPEVIRDDFYVRIDPDNQYTSFLGQEGQRKELQRRAEEMLLQAKRHIDGFATLHWTTYYICPICHVWCDSREIAMWHCQEKEAP